MSFVRQGAAASRSERTPSLLDAACDVFVADLAALTPTDATAWGIPGYDGELEDFSPDYYGRRADRIREMLMDVDAFDEGTDACDDEDDFDDIDHVTADALRDRLGVELDKHHAGEDLRNLNNIASPVQTIRDTFLLMGTDTPEQREALVSRLTKVPAALRGYRESLALAAGNGQVAALRQIDEVVSQCEDLADTGSMLDGLGIADLPGGNQAIEQAKAAFGELAHWLADHLAPKAGHDDAVGRERYELLSHEFLGDEVDLDEAYKWGCEQLQEIIAEQQRIAAELYGSEVSVREALGRLNQEEKYLIEGTKALHEWMQATADRAIADVNGTHFTIPPQICTIEAAIDPAGTGGIFYTPPNDDLTRPGRMWWSVPAGQHTFHTWQELTTVYHESVPGHHLQCGVALCQGTNLNLWRRLACWISGHGEGWALYAEQLMAEFGYFEDPGFRMGLLDSQRLRAARVVLDIGVHLRKKTPDGAGLWDASYARSFLRENTAMDEANLNFEINRYLGWPGQAPSYALGQRMWQEIRQEATAQGMSLRDFHDTALALGSVPMSVLRHQLTA